MPEHATVPFAGLTPELILDALDAVGLRGDGRMVALNSYENRVYQVYLDDGSVVVAKFYRPGRWSDAAIAEEHRFVAELAAQEIPAVAALAHQGRSVFHFGGFRYAVYPRRGGRAPELEDFDTLVWLGRLLGRIHAVGATGAFEMRGIIDVASFGDEPSTWLLHSGIIPPELREQYRVAVAGALDAIRLAFSAVGYTSLRVHGDCHGGNVLWTDAGPHFVDFDDCRMGPSVQDLWMLLSGSRAEMIVQLSAVLDGYEQFRAFDRRELTLIEPLRCLRLIHYAAWIARRWDDPAFPLAFPWFTSSQYWHDRILELRDQIVAMQEPPLAA